MFHMEWHSRNMLTIIIIIITIIIIILSLLSLGFIILGELFAYVTVFFFIQPLR